MFTENWFKTVYHWDCLIDGKLPIGPILWIECVLKENWNCTSGFLLETESFTALQGPKSSDWMSLWKGETWTQRQGSDMNTKGVGHIKVEDWGGRLKPRLNQRITSAGKTIRRARGGKGRPTGLQSWARPCWHLSHGLPASRIRHSKFMVIKTTQLVIACYGRSFKNGLCVG